MAYENFDLVVIGGGPAGYVAAIRAAQLGMKVACIEKRNTKTFGGTCLNVGCIPSKALLDSSEHYAYAKSKLQKHGIQVGEVKLDLAQMLKRKDAVVRNLVGGIGLLFRKHKVEGIFGTGKLTGTQGQEHLIQVDTESGARSLQAKKVLLATGSEATELPFLKFDQKDVLSSTEALEIPQVPRHLAVIGGGVIGLELGSVWLRLGAKVTVVEYQDRICPGVDKQIGNELYKSLLKQGMEFLLSTKCTGSKVNAKGQRLLQLEKLADQSKVELECDKILVAVGRRPYTQGLGLDKVGITLDKAGRVPVDAHYQTSVPGIYAVGDIIAGPMLAHKAEEEGIAAIEIMAGQAGHVNYQAIPNIIYTWPEMASVGFTEEELKEKGIAYKAGSFPFLANGRAKAMEETEGFVKILSDQTTDRVLGMHILGPWASDLIAEGVSVIEFGGSAEDIARTCHGHPTLSETVKEAALAVDKRQIHM